VSKRASRMHGTQKLAQNNSNVMSNVVEVWILFILQVSSHVGIIFLACGALKKVHYCQVRDLISASLGGTDLTSVAASLDDAAHSKDRDSTPTQIEHAQLGAPQW
jgi:hypothetical protein